MNRDTSDGIGMLAIPTLSPSPSRAVIPDQEIHGTHLDQSLSCLRRREGNRRLLLPEGLNPLLRHFEGFLVVVDCWLPRDS
jgi:hypothetical protein